MTNYWEKIDGFRSPGEVLRFEAWIMEQIAGGTAIKVPVSAPYSVGGFDEEWFQHLDSGEIWRLVKPDFPFTGLFERVADWNAD
ncbi:hypothetical protein [Devosia sp. XK-2]|uniref:hypothetical protein n=1 Tax=Devosia sp. XK-2 TaxID=3126689 RepID=UPI0030D5CC0C